MIITPGNILLIIAVLLFVSVLASKAGSRYGMPALLIFLGIGMLAGQDGFGLQFDSGETAEFIGMISLCIILFSGGLDTEFKKIRPVLAPGVILATVGVVITMVLTGVFIHEMMAWLLPALAFGWVESMLLAAIMSSTDSASVFSILNSSKTGLKQNLKPLLELESGSNDPMAYLMVIMLIGMMESGASFTFSSLGALSVELILQLLLGLAGGLAIGWLSVKIVRKVNCDNEFLYPILVIACCFFAFTLTGLVGGNSYLGVYVAGLYVGNSSLPLKKPITTFFGGFTWLVQILMFLTLGLLVNPAELLHIILPGCLLALFLIIIARPVSVYLCLSFFPKFTLKARTYVSWVGLRGAVPIIFATYALMSPDVPHARFMFNIVFFVTLVSLMVQGTTVTSMARWLGLTMPTKSSHFEVELPDEILSMSSELVISAQHLTDGDTLKSVSLPVPDSWAILLRRGDNYMVPDGKTKLHIGDILLLVPKDDHKS